MSLQDLCDQVPQEELSSVCEASQECTIGGVTGEDNLGLDGCEGREGLSRFACAQRELACAVVVKEKQLIGGLGLGGEKQEFTRMISLLFCVSYNIYTSHV